MIRFQCPRCRSTFDVSDTRAGHKTACPKCGQRLQVPAPPLNRTVLAPLMEHWPNPAPRPLAPPVAQVVYDVPLGPAPLPQAIPNAPPDPSPLIDLARVRYPRRRRWLLGLGAVLLVALLILGLRLLLTGGHLRSAGSVAENRSHTRTDEEALVKLFVLNGAEDESRVEFLTWGPHMGKAEWRALLDETGLPELARTEPSIAKGLKLWDFDAIIRVRYRAPTHNFAGREEPGKRKVYDRLFPVAGKFIRGFRGFGESGIGKGSDDWKKELHKQLAKEFPGMRP